MSNLIQMAESVKAEIKINSEGQAVFSIRGGARLLGVDRMSLFKGGDFKSIKLSEMLTAKGFDAATLIEKGIPDIALAVMAHYFAYQSKVKSEQAQQLCMAFMAIGIRAWVHEQLNWQPNQQSIQHQRLYWERLRLFESKTKIPLGYWCIFSEIGGLMRDLETGGVVLPAGACPDISVGKCWNPYLRSKGYDTNVFETYKHHYPDHRGVCDAKIYPDELLALFREWLGFTYIPGKFPKYVRDICPVKDLELIAMAVGNPFQLRLKSA